MTIRPLRVVTAAVDSEVGELQGRLGSASLVSGNGPWHGFLSRGLQQTRQRRSVGTESHGRSLRLLGMSATCGGRLGENFGDLRSRTAWAGRKIVEFFGTHLQGSISGGKGFPTVARPLPPVNSSTSRFLHGEIVFFKGYSNFLCGGPKVPLPASQPLGGWPAVG